MKKGCLIALGIPVGLVILVAACLWLNFYDVHVRYRLTIEVQDGDQIKTGSSVIEASYNVEPSWSPSGPGARVHIDGFEPVVDLGEKGILYLDFSNATRTPDQIRESGRRFFCAADDMYCLPFVAYGKPGTGVKTAHDQRAGPLQELLRQSGPRDLPFTNLPELYRFREAQDWPYRTRVMPSDLAASFGAGVELKRVVLELTPDPISPASQIWRQWLKKNGII